MTKFSHKKVTDTNIENANKKNLKFLDGIRAIAAMFVLISHMWYQIWPAAAPPFGFNERPTGLTLKLTSWLYYGHFAVVVFIVLSGFCLMLPVVQGDGKLRDGAIKFLKRRARRILPPYYFALFLSLFLIRFFIGSKTGSQWDITLPVTPFGVIANLLMLQDIVVVTQINYVFWSLALIWQLYLCFPIIVISWQRLGSIGTTVAIAFLTYTIITLLESIGVKEVPPQYIVLCFNFVLGMLGATIVFSQEQVWYQLRKGFPWVLNAGIFAMLIIFFCYLWGFDRVEKHLGFLDNLCAISTLSLIVAASRPGNNIIRDFLSLKALVVIGTFSYSLYLIHAPLIQVIWQYILHPFKLGDLAEFSLLLILGTPLILSATYIFYIFCERPFLNTRRVPLLK